MIVMYVEIALLKLANHFLMTDSILGGVFIKLENIQV